MFKYLTARRELHKKLRKAWATWAEAALSRIYLPYPLPELGEPEAQPGRRRAWQSYQRHHLSTLRRVLPHEEYQQLRTSVESRTYDVLQGRATETATS